MAQPLVISEDLHVELRRVFFWCCRHGSDLASKPCNKLGCLSPANTCSSTLLSSSPSRPLPNLHARRKTISSHILKRATKQTSSPRLLEMRSLLRWDVWMAQSASWKKLRRHSRLSASSSHVSCMSGIISLAVHSLIASLPRSRRRLFKTPGSSIRLHATASKPDRQRDAFCRYANCCSQ